MGIGEHNMLDVFYCHAVSSIMSLLVNTWPTVSIATSSDCGALKQPLCSFDGFRSALMITLVSVEFGGNVSIKDLKPCIYGLTLCRSSCKSYKMSPLT